MIWDVHPGSESRIPIFLPIPDHGSRGQKGTGSATLVELSRMVPRGMRQEDERDSSNNLGEQKGKPVERVQLRNCCYGPGFMIRIMIEESRAGSGFLPRTNRSGSGSGRPKNIRILRICIRNTGMNQTESGSTILVIFQKNCRLLDQEWFTSKPTHRFAIAHIIICYWEEYLSIFCVALPEPQSRLAAVSSTPGCCRIKGN